MQQPRQVAEAEHASERHGEQALVGWIGVTRETPYDRRAMLGYWLGEEHHGHGYMREAAPAAVQMAFQQLNLGLTRFSVVLPHFAWK